jgi:hypothetical protein
VYTPFALFVTAGKEYVQHLVPAPDRPHPSVPTRSDPYLNRNLSVVDSEIVPDYSRPTFGLDDMT